MPMPPKIDPKTDLTAIERVSLEEARFLLVDDAEPIVREAEQSIVLR